MMGGTWREVMLAALVVCPTVSAQAETPADVAAAFGAREAAEDISLSPDGTKLAVIAPTAGPGSVLYVRDVADGSKPHGILNSDGRKEQLRSCNWVSSQRLVCTVHGVADVAQRKVDFTRLFAVDTDGKNLRVLSTRQNEYSRDVVLGGGAVVDWLPEEDGAVLMARVYTPDEHTGSHAGSSRDGLGVDRIDTNTLALKSIELPKDKASDYISDGRGAIRILGLYDVTGVDRELLGTYTYQYRRPGSRTWEKLPDGFHPAAVDHDLNVAYGFRKKDGRLALYSVALDGTLAEKLILARSDVDVDGLARIGRRNRVVGASYDTDTRQVVYFDPEIAKIAAGLVRALPKAPMVRVVDSSVDERKLLIFAGGDTDPGAYYLFDRDKHELHIIAAARLELEGRTLATMKPIRYKAADGTEIPAFLTLPPGKESAKGLPAIVMPHGGPADRDTWGFDWLPQYYAAQGFAVLQPEFRGSSGYGDGWYKNNGFKSWRTAVGDVVDAGRWLVGEGIADPHKLAIMGWSYGGYAALQSAVIAPDLFKAVVAVAPVTDLAMLKNESMNWTDNLLYRDLVGTGPHIREGSPAQNADKIKVPVLLVHGTMDANVDYSESTFMASRLKSAGGKVQLITFDGLDHHLEDATARTRMLTESDAFLRAAIGQ